jgi:hypothetical protein
MQGGSTVKGGRTKILRIAGCGRRTGDRVLDLRAIHSVSGNPDRLATGPVELRPDAEWETAMRPADRRLMTALSWPLLLRYGYLRGG